MFFVQWDALSYPVKQSQSSKVEARLTLGFFYLPLITQYYHSSYFAKLPGACFVSLSMEKKEQAENICIQIQNGGFGTTSKSAEIAIRDNECHEFMLQLRDQIEYGDVIKSTFLGTDIDNQVIEYFKPK